VTIEEIDYGQLEDDEEEEGMSDLVVLLEGQEELNEVIDIVASSHGSPEAEAEALAFELSLLAEQEDEA